MIKYFLRVWLLPGGGKCCGGGWAGRRECWLTEWRYHYRAEVWRRVVCVWDRHQPSTVTRCGDGQSWTACWNCGKKLRD